MSHIESEFSVALDRAALEQRLEALGWNVGDEAGSLAATQGSQVRTRLLGGWFVNKDALPKKLVAQQAGDGCAVKLEDTLGFGLFDPKLKGRYQQAFAEVETELRP